VIARGVSKSGHWLDGPDFGEARPAWGAVPECNTGNPATIGRWARTDARSLRLLFPGLSHLNESKVKPSERRRPTARCSRIVKMLAAT